MIRWHIMAAALASSLLMGADAPSKTSGIVVSVSADGIVTATRDGKRITCGQLRALFRSPDHPKAPQISCKTFRENSISISLHH